MNRNEQQTPTKIAVLGCGALGVTKQLIAKLLEDVGYHTHVIPGTSTVLASAVMPSGFVLATAESIGASPDNGTWQLAIEVAITKAKALAFAELWKLEDYRLKQTMHEISRDHGREALGRLRATVQPAGDLDARTNRRACGCSVGAAQAYCCGVAEGRG